MRTLLGLLLLLSGSLASAQDFQVSGKELAGKARVADGQATLDLVRGKADQASSLSAKAEWRPDGSLRLSWEVLVDQGFGRGLATWLRHPGFSLEAWRPVTKTETAVLRRGPGGVLQGEVGGAAQTWIPAPDTSRWIVLVIPGLSTNNWNEVGIPYLDENQRALRARGLEARRLAIKTEDGVLKNAEFIAREVRAEAARGRQVVLLAHSKGGTDTTAALALYPDLRDKVLGVIAIQPVFGGSYVADLVGSSKALTGTVAVVFEKVFKGQRDAVLDLTHERRAAFVAEHPYPAAAVPTVVIRSSFDRKLSKSTIYPTQKYTKLRFHEPNDGMVALKDQVIPGAVETVTLEDLDHFEPGVRLESEHKPTDVTNVGLDALLRALAARPAPRAAAAVAPGRRVNLRLGE
ncbi:MAG: hypothetical protein AB7N76_15635 [Planctomycetota bacterium]